MHVTKKFYQTDKPPDNAFLTHRMITDNGHDTQYTDVSSYVAYHMQNITVI
jgi:hypothetical protein